MWINVTYIIVGLILLYYGGDFLITGSVRISRLFKISPFIIGATVIAFGTSAPELAVSILAGLKGAPEVAMGNVIGSNIANVGLVLGLTAFLTPLTIEKQRFRKETPPLLIATFLILALAWDFHLNRWEGGFMLFLLIVYVWNALSKKEEPPELIDEESGFLAGKGRAIQLLLIIVGLAFLILGAKLMVDGGVAIAKAQGISEWLIGISIIAVGTSLPEMVSTLVAAHRGHGELAIGNIFGSNIFNILMVLGCTAGVNPLRITEDIHFDLIFTTGLTCLLIALIGRQNALSKWEGFVLLVGYSSYMGLKATGSI